MGKTEGSGFNLKERLRSFGNAFSGIGSMIKTEYNFRIHILILLLVVISGFLLSISPAEWIMLVIVSGIVLSAECLNTAVEYLSDIVSPGYNEKIKRVKDVAAAGVLLSAIAAIITGLLIFVPRIIQIIR
jgi:diacylglycerol kinase (ATP)